MQRHFVKNCATLPISSLILHVDGNGGLLESIKKNFAANLKRLMRDRGLNGEQLAERVGVSSRAVYDWTRGQSLPKIDRLDAIALALKTNFIELVRDPQIPLEHEITIGFLREIAARLGMSIVKDA